MHNMRAMDDRAMSDCGDRSSGPGLPLPALFASIALALILDGLHLGHSKIGGISTSRATSAFTYGKQTLFKLSYLQLS